jgi:voltage-gated potassium channel
MKSLFAVINPMLENRTSRTNLRALVNLLLVLAGLVALYSLVFHLLMQREGQEHSWITGLYWTLTVMTTLGFGDITFQGDLGRLFSVLVLGTGVIFMLVLLPFTFIEFFYAPWMRAQAASKAPRELPPDTRGHVLLTGHGPLASALIPMLDQYGHPCVVLCPTLQEALELVERGVRVAVGDLDDPDTYRRMRLDQAALLITTHTDVININATFTARDLCERVPIVASASSDAARDVLELAGATLVLRLEEMMGAALARRVSIRDTDAHVIGSLDGLLIAEAAADGTPLVGQTLAQSGLRTHTGVSVIGVWDHGRLAVAEAGLEIRADTVFVLAGTREQLDRYNAAFQSGNQEKPRVLIVGGGRVGRATARALDELGIRVTLVEKIAERVAGIEGAVVGDATQIEVLKKAGAREATTLVITTHDDDTNVALTIFFRKLRSNWQILARSTLDRNVKTLLRAGADLVLSYASMGANTVFNLLRGGDHLLLAEGVNVFPAPVPAAVAGQRLGDLQIRSQTGCTVIAIEYQGRRDLNPGPDAVLPAGGRLFLIGTLDAEERFLQRFPPPAPHRRR